jgi:mono/diheme cytochrome c family protein
MNRRGIISLSIGTLLMAAVVAFHTPINASAASSMQARQPTVGSEGAQVYANNCASCHGANREGNPPTFPRLIGISQRMTDTLITERIHNGKGMMPAFTKLTPEELASLLRFLKTAPTAASGTGAAASRATGTVLVDPKVLENGQSVYRQNCAFCHGRDAGGGETGPDLTRSKIVRGDINGDKISEVVRNGRPDNRMPAFHFSDSDMAAVVAFIHSQTAKAIAMGSRKGVDVADLQTGNVEQGKTYFNGAGGCSSCHSPTGDLKGVASRYEGLQLEERMLYPRDAKSTATVTLPSGQVVTGTVAYLDEFTIAVRDASGTYRSWPIAAVKHKIDAPVEAHVALFGKYTDDDIHNLMAYIQTMR